jgi:caspase domain-containing protein
MNRRRWLILLAGALALGVPTVAAISRSGASREPADDLGDLFVLSVGVEPSLTASGKADPYAGDAWFVRRALAQAEPLYATTHSRVLAGPRATRGAVLDALAWLGTSVGDRDVAILFFSAHGSIAPHGTASKEGYYLELAGAGGPEPDCVLFGSELNAALSRVHGRVVLLIDTCSAGAMMPADGRSARRLAVVASCGADECSSGQWERTDRPHGWFVIALCEAFNSSADTNGDGVVTLVEMTAYLPARAKRLYEKQNAVIFLPEGMFDIPLVRIDRNRPAGALWRAGMGATCFTQIDI